jgi:hypothetical protein
MPALYPQDSNVLASMVAPQAFGNIPTPTADPRVAVNIPTRATALEGFNLRRYAESPTGAIEAARDIKKEYGIDIDPTILRKAMDAGQYSFTFGRSGNIPNVAGHEAIHDAEAARALENARLNRTLGLNLPTDMLGEQGTRNQAWAQSIGGTSQPSTDYNMLMAYVGAHPEYRPNMLPYTSPYAAATDAVNRLYEQYKPSAAAAINDPRVFAQYIAQTAALNPAVGTVPRYYSSENVRISKQNRK